MSSRLRAWQEAIGDIFWIRPALLVLGGVLLGEAMIMAERTGTKLPWIADAWIYTGGEAGARALLGAVAASTIGVAGTTFSITVAALSLASAQMGPRLLRNFVRDRGNQYVLGIFLGTFAYALVVLRTVRSVAEVAFVPHLGVTGALVLALLCVGTLVWFVHHVATGINVETVIDGVHAELSETIKRLSQEEPPALPDCAPPHGTRVTLAEHGYLRSVDEDSLADWAAENGAVVVLLVRPGDYLFPGAAIAELVGGREGEAAIRAAFALGPRQAAAQDMEFALRQLVEIALRALSPGINDPFTAIAVLDRLGSALCELVPYHLPGTSVARCGRVVLWRQVTDYTGLCDAMFHMIRQNAAASPGVLIRLRDVLERVMAVEANPARQAELRRHSTLALGAGRLAIKDPADVNALEDHPGMALREDALVPDARAASRGLDGERPFS